ncbi:hypothetical protein DER44DRAFT_883876 [Fusarium oxysporum]|nr:hypothetical protein DER44DRAFT_883876 [Fusarium oxysporum]
MRFSPISQSFQDRLSSNPDLCDSLKGPLENCLNIFDEFATLLQGFTQISRDGTVKIRVWKQMAWAFKDKVIELFRDTITTYKVSLNMALNAMTFSTTTSLNERTFKDIRPRLQALDGDRIELASLAGRNGSEWYGTEADFAMRRFLEYTESLCDSPPASFPGSPAEFPSEAYDELGTKEGTQGTASPHNFPYANLAPSGTEKHPMSLHGTPQTQRFDPSCFEPNSLPFEPYTADLYVMASSALNSQSPSCNHHPPGSSQTSNMSYATMDRITEAYQPSIDDATPPKTSAEPINKEINPRISTLLTGLRIPESKHSYSKSAFDADKALWLVSSRKAPQINIGTIGMSCSFVFCDIALEECPIIYVSDSFQELTGYSRYEAMGRNGRFLQAPNGKVERGLLRRFVDARPLQGLRNNIRGNRESQMSLINYRKGGSQFLNLLSIIPIPWDTEETRYYVGFQIDLVESPKGTH